jgi:aryl-alcohol dehydrogenase-like predicted oxidoreductase
LDDLVKSGKVRYVGISDAPAWKVAQAQVMAHFCGWNPLTALQIEYSLMERTVEGALVLMAEELGLGVLSWGPLKIGALTGKYTRSNGAKMRGPRGARAGEFTEKQYDIIDAVGKIAAKCETSSSTVALACLKTQSGVALYDYWCPNT